MPLWIGDYLRDTSHLRAAQSGAYMHLIMHYWQKGELPNDDFQLATIARMTDHEWRQSRPIIEKFFQPGWKHNRIDRELVEAAEAYERRAKAGRKGAAARHGRGNVTSIATSNRTGNRSSNGGGNA